MVSTLGDSGQVLTRVAALVKTKGTSSSKELWRRYFLATIDPTSTPLPKEVNHGHDRVFCTPSGRFLLELLSIGIFTIRGEQKVR